MFKSARRDNNRGRSNMTAKCFLDVKIGALETS